MNLQGFFFFAFFILNQDAFLHCSVSIPKGVFI